MRKRKIPSVAVINMCLELTKNTPETADYFYNDLKNILNMNKADKEKAGAVLDFVRNHRDNVYLIKLDRGGAWNGEPQETQAHMKLNQEIILRLLKESQETDDSGKEKTIVVNAAEYQGQYLRSYQQEVEPREELESKETSTEVVSSGKPAAQDGISGGATGRGH